MVENLAADIGLIGLAVMGENLVLNMDSHGYRVVVYNRTLSKVEDFLAGKAKGTKVIGSTCLEDFVSKLKKPRLIIIMIMAGNPVDDLIDRLMVLLDPGDVIIDGGNSDYSDTRKRFWRLEDKKIHFVGTGISGGEKGARYGPSLMPGGSKEAWPLIKSIFESTAAKVGNDSCVAWMGPDGAGHYVKMVHNGIEYGDMQLICEAYHIMKSLLHLDCDKMKDVFAEWNKGPLESYLIEITRDIMATKENGECLVEKIRDTAGQKGTGKWTVIDGLNMGVPITLISEAVFARCLSAMKDERIKCSQIYSQKKLEFNLDSKEFIEDIMKALYASKIVSYAQGFMLLRAASIYYNWNLNLGEIAMIWRGGCIIKSRFLSNIYDAFKRDPKLTSLIVDNYFSSQIESCQESWRRVVSTCVIHGIPVPAFSSALAFFDGYRSNRLPANLLQAQRDYFGAHTFEYEKDPGKFVHFKWDQE